MDEPQKIIFEYYQLPFRQLMIDVGKDIERAMTVEREQARSKFWTQFTPKKISDPEEAWTLTMQYADYIESVMAPIIACHSVFFWIHLYRRIGVFLYPGLPSKTDAPTLYLVRNTMEAAFLKHGALSFSSDVRNASEVQLEQILGGLFQKSLTKVTSQLGESASRFAELGNQLVLIDFQSTDFVNIFRLEALAYEYWRASAKLRAIGKGASIVIYDGDVHEDRSDTFNELLVRHDKRTAKLPFISSNLGVSFADLAPAAHPLQRLLCPSYNVARTPYTKMNFSEHKFDDQFVSNFVLAPFQLDSYVRAHQFASSDFRRKYQFGFEELCVFLSAAAYVPLAEAGSEQDPESQLALALLRIHQRAYYARPNNKAAIIERIVSIAKNLDLAALPYGQQVEAEASVLFDFLTLTPEKQPTVSLWSHGPRSIFLPHGEQMIVDLQGLALILNTLFFRVSHDQTSRGLIFETSFRQLIQDQGFDLLPNRELVNVNGERRETDAAVRIHNDLILCDCRSIWMPLDYEIGKPKTVEIRKAFLQKKIERTLSIGEFVHDNIAGRNYDFSWARRVMTVAISPFVEWTWSLSDDFWIDKGKNLPRVLSVSEALNMFSALRLRSPNGGAKTKHKRQKRKKRKHRLKSR